MRLLLVVALALGSQPLALAAPAAAAAARKISVPLTLPGALEREVRSARQVARSLGVHIVDLQSGARIFGFEEDRLRILASNTKLLTTAAALERLGPNFVFETPVLTRGAITDGVLAGDLAVVGSGDPNISGRGYDGDPYVVFRDWAHALQARGIFRVSGDLFLVNGTFAAPVVHPDWPRDQLTNWYEAPVDSLSFSDNCVLVRVIPGRRAGQAPHVEAVPALPLFQIHNSARTSDSSRQNRLFVGRDRDGRVITVSGSIWKGSGPAEVWLTVVDPPAYFAAALRAALAEEGIEIAGGTQKTSVPLTGAWERVAVHRSDLQTTLEVTNKRSQNFYAESLMKVLGFRECGTGSWPSGVEAVLGYLHGIGIEPIEVELADGSGLSRHNRMTARAMTQLLSRMFFHRFGREFLLSLPHSGEEGLRWERRLATPPYRGNVFAKTGTINGVSTLSGYAKAASGKVYAFSILCNQVRSTGDAMRAQDRIVRALIDRG